MADAKWAAEERKLMPAFDDLRTGRFKSVDSQVKQWLKKHPHSQPALVLRMALLAKTTQSPEDVVAAFEAVKKTGELSSRAMWLTTNTMRNIRRLDLVLGLYQDLWNKHPELSDVGEQVFLTAISIWDQPVVVSASRKMFNTHKTAGWARIAAWAEWVTKAPQPAAHRPVPPPAPPNALRIATTLLSTTGRTSPTADTFWLRVQILVSAGQLEDAYRFLEEDGSLPVGGPARSWWRMKMSEVVLERLGERGDPVEDKWTTTWDLARRVLLEDESSRRNYAVYQHLLVCTMANPNLIPETKKLLGVVGQVIKSDGIREPAPALAGLELDRWCDDKQTGGAMSLEDWESNVREYMDEWLSKEAAIGELAGVVGQEPQRRARLLTLALERTKPSHSTETEYRSCLHASLLAVRLRDAVAATEDEVNAAWRNYADGLQYGKDLPSTEVQPADKAGLLAVWLLVHRWHANKDDERPLFQALTRLMYVVSRSPSCAEAHFLLIRLLRIIGAPSLIVTPLSTLVDEMKLNEIQLDTLYHVISERGFSDVLLGRMEPLFSSLSFKADNMRNKVETDMGEYVKQALQNEAFSKIHGIRELQQSLHASIPQALWHVQSVLTALLRGDSPTSDQLSGLLAKSKTELADTRDWELLPDFAPHIISTRQMIGLGKQTDESSIQDSIALCSLATAVARGEPVESNVKPGPSALPAEGAAYAVLLYLNTAQEPPSNQGHVNGPAEKEIDSAIDRLFETSTSSADSRWTLLYSATLIALVMAVMRSAEKAVLANQVTGSKKKANVQPADKGKLDLIRHGLQSYRDRMDGLLEQLDKQRDQDLSLTTVSSTSEFVDIEFAQKSLSSIVEARISALDELKLMLTRK